MHVLVPNGQGGNDDVFVSHGDDGDVLTLMVMMPQVYSCVFISRYVLAHLVENS